MKDNYIAERVSGKHKWTREVGGQCVSTLSVYVRTPPHKEAAYFALQSCFFILRKRKNARCATFADNQGSDSKGWIIFLIAALRTVTTLDLCRYHCSVVLWTTAWRVYAVTGQSFHVWRGGQEGSPLPQPSSCLCAPRFPNASAVLRIKGVAMRRLSDIFNRQLILIMFSILLEVSMAIPRQSPIHVCSKLILGGV